MPAVSLGIQWRDYQKEFLRFITSPDAKGTTTAIKAPRQVGKTTVLMAVLLHYGCTFRNGFSIIMEPTYKQCIRVYNEMRAAFEPILTDSGKSQLVLEFITGSKVQFLSGESDIAAFQGYVCKNGVLCIDEAAFIGDDVFYALNPTTDVHKCPIILTSTPRFRKGFFYDYYAEGSTNTSPVVKCFDWAGKTILTPEKLAFYKKTLPERLFNNYYLGEFADATGSVFGEFHHVLSNDYEQPTYYEMKWETNIDCYAGIDWGTGQNQDYTVFSVFNSLKQQIYIERWNNLDETQTVKKIVKLIQEFKPITVQYETNGIGTIFGGLLSKACVNAGVESGLRPFNTSNSSKNKLVNQLVVAIQNNEVQLLNNEQLISEMSTYESVVSNTGKLIYNGAKGCHDDMVIATMLSFDLVCRKGNMYNII